MCQVKDYNTLCVCPKCEEVYAPVCGTDGLSYASNCYLKLAACTLSRNVKFGKDGPCGMHLLYIFLRQLL